jgi:hypothetical protein
VKDEAGVVEEEEVEAIAKTTQEAVFWTGKFGYPVTMAPSEKVYRQVGGWTTRCRDRCRYPPLLY